MRAIFLALGLSAFVLISLDTAPRAPTVSPLVLVDEARLEMPAEQVAFEGTTAYVVGGGCASDGSPPRTVCVGTLTVVDLSVPTAPRVAGRLTPTGEAFARIDIQGSRLFTVLRASADYGVPTPVRLAALDVSDPTRIVELWSRPVIIQRWADLNYLSLEVTEDHLFFATYGGFTIYDIAGGAAPTELAIVPGPVTDIAVSGPWLLVTGVGLRILDVTDPANPTELGAVCPWCEAGSFEGVEAYGDRAFVVSAVMCPGERGMSYRCGSSLAEYDVSDPRDPKVVWSSGGPSSYISTIAIDGDLLFVGSGGLRVLDMARPERPEVGYDAGSVADVAPMGEHRLVVAANDALRVLRVGRRSTAYLPLAVRGR